MLAWTSIASVSASASANTTEMSVSNDSDAFDTLSLAETDFLSDFELVDIDHDDVRFFASSSVGSDVASIASDVETTPPSPQMDASQFHFPDPASVFQGEQLSLESSSMYTISATSPLVNDASVLLPTSEPQSHQHHVQLSAASATDLGMIEKMDFMFQPEQKQVGPSLPYRSFASMRRSKSVWLVALLAAMLLGFRSSTLLGLTNLAPIVHHPKFASPSQIPATSSTILSARTPPSLALAANPSPSSIVIGKARKPSPDAQCSCSSSSRIRSVALQKTSATSKSLSILGWSSVQSSTLRNAARSSSLGAKHPRGKRYDAHAAQMAFNTYPNLPVFPSLSASSYLENATTMTWAFWLTELSHVYQRSLQPAILAAKEQAYHAARLVQRYHEQQILPTFADLRQQAFYAAHQTAEFTSRCNREQVRPAFDFVHEHATQTAQRTAKYHQTVLSPAFVQVRRQAAEAAKTTCEELHKAAKRTARMASQYRQQQLGRGFVSFCQQAAESAQSTAKYREQAVVLALAQLRLQAVEAAKTASEGVNKAAKHFASEASPTVQQIKETTCVNLEALHVDDYVGFMMSTFKSIKQNLLNADQTV